MIFQIILEEDSVVTSASIFLDIFQDALFKQIIWNIMEQQLGGFGKL
jgi:hypothetical protein